MESFDEFYWKHNDYLNKDTSLAHSFGEKVWLHKQQEVDELQKRIDYALFELEQLHLLKTANSNNAIKILKGAANET